MRSSRGLRLDFGSKSPPASKPSGTTENKKLLWPGVERDGTRFIVAARKRAEELRKGPASRSAGERPTNSVRTSAGYRPPAAAERPSYAGVPSFLKLPIVQAPSPVPAVDVFISGVPFDGGTPHRPGARFGPRALREASALARSYSPALGIDTFEELSAADGGDVVPATEDVGSMLDAVAERALELARSGVIGGFVGGDQTVTLGALRGIRAAKHKALSFLHFDAHPNGAPSTQGRSVHHTSVVRNAVEEGLFRTDAALQIGMRGPYASAEDGNSAALRGIEAFSLDQVRMDLHSVTSQVRRLVGRGLLYVSVDVSVLDPSFAPDTAMPSPGGMTTWELQQLLRALVGAEIIGFDVVEIAPAYDPLALTPLVGVTILQELLAVIADTRRSARPAPSTNRVPSRGRKWSP